MKRSWQVALVLLLLALFTGVVTAAPPAQEEAEGVDYTVQPGDHLMALARLFFDDADAFTRIVEATNARAATDSSYRVIRNPNIILVGETLFIPGLAALPGVDDSAAETAPPVPEVDETDETAETEIALAGTRWELTSLGGESPLEETTLTLAFENETDVSGTSGCNGFGGSYEVDGIRISFGPLAGTLLACEEPVMDQENAFRAALGEAALFDVSAEQLRLYDADRTLLLTFAPATTALAGTSWEVVNYNNGNEAVVGVLEDTMLTAVFGDDGQISGAAGCNSYFGPYTAADGAIEIGPLAATLRACIPDETMVQEAAFLAALEGAATYTITGDSLEMRSADDALMVIMVRAE